MNLSSLLRLVLLSAIWGASFLFMRIGAPALGPVWLIEARVALAALFLLAVALLLGKKLAVRKHWRHYLILGLVNSALPFILFAYAAQTLSASLLSILNATAPIWGAAMAALWTRRGLEPTAAMGLALGIGGVAILVGFDRLAVTAAAAPAMAATLAAAACYGAASIYAKAAPASEPFANAHGSMWAAALLLVPALPLAPAVALPTRDVLAAVIVLGVVCSGVAYLLYFKLIADIGATRALTVTFLIPVFGIAWGYLLLGEAIGWHTLAGAAVVLLGTALATGFLPLRRRLPEEKHA